MLQAVNRGAPVAGIVMMSGAGRPIMPVLREQISKQLPPDEIAKWDSASARYLRGEDPATCTPASSQLLQPANRKFMQSWAKYDPAAEIAKVKVPVLIIQGGHDIQISEADARALKAAQPAAKLVVIPAANHVYRQRRTTDRMPSCGAHSAPSPGLIKASSTCCDVRIVSLLVQTVVDFDCTMRDHEHRSEIEDGGRIEAVLDLRPRCESWAARFRRLHFAKLTFPAHTLQRPD